jgi:hypothetical protein
MRRIELKTLTMTVTDPEGKDVKIPFSYRDSLLSAIETMPENGFTLSDMEKRLRIRKKLIEGSGDVLLDNDDYNALLGCVEKQRFRVMSDAIVDYVHAVRSAKTE